jgi:hypothetical protein
VQWKRGVMKERTQNKGARHTAHSQIVYIMQPALREKRLHPTVKITSFRQYPGQPISWP